MDPGQIIKVTTQCVPKGLVPDKIVEVLYQFEKGRYYVRPTEKKEFSEVVDSSCVAFLRQELS